MSEKFVVKINHQLHENGHAVFYKEWSIFYLSWNSTFLDVGSIVNIDQHNAT